MSNRIPFLGLSLKMSLVTMTSPAAEPFKESLPSYDEMANKATINILKSRPIIRTIVSKATGIGVSNLKLEDYPPDFRWAAPIPIEIEHGAGTFEFSIAHYNYKGEMVSVDIPDMVIDFRLGDICRRARVFTRRYTQYTRPREEGLANIKEVMETMHKKLRLLDPWWTDKIQEAANVLGIDLDV